MPKHKVVVGLGFGDEGKGTIVDYLASPHYPENFDAVVRFSGGPQAAHNVITDDGRHHTFSQFGSGTFHGLLTILSRYMSVNPFNLAVEAEALEEKIGYNPIEKLIMSENSLLITPWHQAFNRLEEIRRGDAAHGSCGQGIGIAQKFAVDYPDMALRIGDLKLGYDSFVAKASIVFQLLKAEYGLPTTEQHKGLSKPGEGPLLRSAGNLFTMYEYFMKDHNPIIASDEYIAWIIGELPCIFEGSQGALLDEWKGFHPYTTWSTTTSQNALQLLSEASVDDEDIEVIGVSRTYHTRHGYGPFPTEDKCLLEDFPEPHNGTGKFQGAWRVGAFDMSLFKYGVDINHPDSLAFTHMDYEDVPMNTGPGLFLSDQIGDLAQQEEMTEYLFKWESRDGIDGPFEMPSDHMVKIASQMVEVPISIFSYGPQANQKVNVDRPDDR